MEFQTLIEEKLFEHFEPRHLDVINESKNHSVPIGSQTHFKVVIVSEKFENQPSLNRHKAIYGLVGDLMKQGLHALAIHAFTPEEWIAAKEKYPPSPACRSWVLKRV